MKGFHKLFKVLWYSLLLFLIAEFINGIITLNFFYLELENEFIFRINWILFPLICIISLFLIFFFPTFYKNRATTKLKFISRHLKIKNTNSLYQFLIDLLFGSLFFYLELLFFSFLLEYGILYYEIYSVRFGSLGLSIIFIDIVIISIIYNKLILKMFSFFILYSSVIAIIIVPMLIFIGAPFFFFYFYDISWIFVDPTIMWIPEIREHWLNSNLNISNISINELYVIKIIIFLVGAVIFTIALVQLTIGKIKNKGIVQKGFYRYIRHPQNIAIIIMVFSLFIFPKIRMGDIITWIQFTFLMIFYSDYGDIRLKKKYPNKFELYYQNTGFMFPKLFSSNLTEKISIFQNKKLRYILILLMYIGIILICYICYLILPFEIQYTTFFLKIL